MLLVGTGVVFGGWAAIQSMHKQDVPLAGSSARVELPADVDADIQRLAPVRRFDEATVGRAALAARGLAELVIRLEPAVTAPGFDVAVVDGQSNAVVSRVPADSAPEHRVRVRAGEHQVVLVASGRSACRAYSSRVTARVGAGDSFEARLPTELGSVTVALGSLSKPPIVELARTDDSYWHAEDHSGVSPSQDGTFRVRFESIGFGPYLVIVHGLEAADTRHPVTVRGDELVKISSQLR